MSCRIPQCTWCGQRFDADHAVVGMQGTVICESCADLATMRPTTVIHLVPESACHHEPEEVRL